MKRLLSLSLCFLFGHGVLAQAHDPGLSSAELTTRTNRIVARLTFSSAEIQSLGEIERVGVGALRIESNGNSIPGRLTRVERSLSDALRLELVFEMSRPATRMYVSSPLLLELPRGHRQFVSVRDESGRVVAERVLNASSPGFSIILEGNSFGVAAAQSLGRFVSLGVEHILTGYDHLLFLFGLLVVGGGFRSAARIITSFTIAHSLTLALATFDVIRVSPTVVEPLIAVSIIYVGAENLSGRGLKRRWLLTFGFGLIHGLGFASVLEELGINGSRGGSAFAPLLGFNLGVELGQIAVAAMVLPLIWRVGRHRDFAVPFGIAGSLAVTAAGAFWLFERVLVW